MKNVLILSYEGNVKINNIPQNMKRDTVIDVARLALQGKLNKPLTNLNNIEYYVNSQIYNYLNKRLGFDYLDIETYEKEEKDFIDINIDYEDYKL